MEYISVIFQKFYKEIIAALTLIVLGALVSPGVVTDEPYDPYKERVQGIDIMMQDVISNPSTNNIINAQDQLAIQGDWAYRLTGAQKEDFEAYLESCNTVLIKLYKNQDIEQSVIKMNAERDNLI